MRLFIYVILIFYSDLKTQNFKPVQIDTTKLKSELKSFYRTNRLASLSFGIFQGYQLNKTFSYGYYNLTKKYKTNSDIYYPLASVTKPITASLVINAVDSNLIEFSDFASKYIKGFPESITIRDLLVHDSGIRRNKNYEKLLAANSLSDIESFIPKHVKTNSKFKYTNINYAFLGRILENVYQKPFEEIADHYLNKSKTTSKQIHFLTNKPDSIIIANSYVLKGRRRYPHKMFVTDIWKPAALAIANSNGMLNFLRNHMNQNYIKHVTNYPEHVRKRWFYNGQDNVERYGYGFRLLFSDDELIYIYHNGFMFGALTTIYYLPQYDIGFVAMTNTSGYPKQKINFSSSILRIVKRSIINRSKLNELTQNMFKMK